MFPPGLQVASANGASEPKEADQFGLGGLALLARMERTTRNNFSMGQDVDILGFDLADDSSILQNLGLPWLETSVTDVEPHFLLPSTIHDAGIPSPEPCDTKIQSFQDETLFYIFYTKPRDTLQEYAARELVARNWRYHRDIQAWLTKDSNVEPVLVSPDVERGVYIFFDQHNWEKIRKEFVLHYSSVQA